MSNTINFADFPTATTDVKGLMSPQDKTDLASKVDYPVLSAEGTTVKNAKYAYGDVRRYGAVGDGTTDCTDAFANAVAINDTVLIPEGTFFINHVVPYNTTSEVGKMNGIIGKDNLTIKGAGMDKSIILTGPDVTLYLSPLMFVECDNLHICDFTIDGNKEVISGDIYDQLRGMIIRSSTKTLVERCRFTHSWGTGISYNSLTYFTVKDCYFDNIDSGINGAGSGYTRNMLVENCVFDGHDKSEPVVLEHGENLTIRKCFIDNKQNSNGFWISRVEKVLIEDCVIKNCSCGIMLNRNCITDNGADEIVQLPTDIHIRNNRFYNCFTSIRVNGVMDVSSSSNVFYRSPVYVQDCELFKSYDDKFLTYYVSDDYSKTKAIRFGNLDSLSADKYTLSVGKATVENPTFDNTEGVANSDVILINATGYVKELTVKDAVLKSCTSYTATGGATSLKIIESMPVATESEMQSTANSLISTIWEATTYE